MKNIINKLFVNHSLIYKLALYIVTIVLVVYLFPKGGQFKYEFQKGKPWEYENYYAPFDFAIKKTTNEIEIEKNEILNSSKQFFVFDDEIVNSVKNKVTKRITELFINSDVNDDEKYILLEVVNVILNEIYTYGYLKEENKFTSSLPSLITLRKGNQIQDIQSNKLFNSKEILSFLLLISV